MDIYTGFHGNPCTNWWDFSLYKSAVWLTDQHHRPQSHAANMANKHLLMKQWDFNYSPCASSEHHFSHWLLYSAELLFHGVSPLFVAVLHWRGDNATVCLRCDTLRLEHLMVPFVSFNPSVCKHGVSDWGGHSWSGSISGREISQSADTVLGWINGSHPSRRLNYVSGHSTKAFRDMQCVFH